jgi:hypothetical protein
MEIGKFAKKADIPVARAKLLAMAVFGDDIGTTLPDGGELVILAYLLLEKCRLTHEQNLAVIRMSKERLMRMGLALAKVEYGADASLLWVAVQDGRYVTFEEDDVSLDLNTFQYLSARDTPLPVHNHMISLTAAYARTFGLIDNQGVSNS